MKIGIVITTNQAGGGTYQYTFSILRALYHASTKDEFVIFIWPGSSFQLDEFVGPHWTTERLDPHIISTFEDIKPYLLGDGIDLRQSEFNTQARNFFLKHNIDLLIYPAPSTLSFESGIPYIMAVHDLQHRLQPEFPEVSAGGSWQGREYLFRNNVRYAQAILVDSAVGKEDVLTFYGQYISEDRVYPLPFSPAYRPGAIEISNFRKDALRKKYAVPIRFLFYPAQFWLHKNHARLIHALSQLRFQHKIDIPLVIVGSNHGSPQEARELVFQNAMFLAKQLGVQDLVHYLGYVHDEDMPVLYSMAAALTMPTFFGPTNIPILEAWAFDCPVLTSDIRGIRDQVGDAGLLVNPKNAEAIADGIFRLWTNTDLCDSLRKAGHKKLSSYTMEDFAKKLLTILNEVKKRVHIAEAEAKKLTKSRLETPAQILPVAEFQNLPDQPGLPDRSEAIVVAANLVPFKDRGQVERQQDCIKSISDLRSLGVVPLNICYEDECLHPSGWHVAPLLKRSADLELKIDGKRKPFVTDLFDIASQWAEQQGIKWFALSNSDIIFTPLLIKEIHRLVKDGYETLAISRSDVVDIDPVSRQLYGYLEVQGSDVFVCGTEWWQNNRRLFQPYIFGERAWDNAFASIMACHSKSLILFQEDLCYHSKHEMNWLTGPYADYNMSIYNGADRVYRDKYAAFMFDVLHADKKLLTFNKTAEFMKKHFGKIEENIQSKCGVAQDQSGKRDLDADVARKVIAYVNQADRHIANNDLASAREAIKQALQHASGHAQLCALLSNMLANLGDPQSANDFLGTIGKNR